MNKRCSKTTLQQANNDRLFIGDISRTEAQMNAVIVLSLEVPNPMGDILTVDFKRYCQLKQ